LLNFDEKIFKTIKIKVENNYINKIGANVYLIPAIYDSPNKTTIINHMKK